MKAITFLLKKHLYHILIFLILFFLSCFIWEIGLKIPSSYTDVSFHLATAKGYLRAGGVTTWDFWESLPLGRPNNYPPLFHLILATFLKFNLSPSVAIKLMMELSVVGGLSAYAWAVTKLFNIKTAFWSSFLLAFSFHFVQLSSTVMPATMAIFLSPVLFCFSVRKKWLAYSALLTLIFYLHLFMPYLILLSLMIYFFLFERKQILQLIIYSSAGFILYSPWLIHIFTGGFEYIKYFDPRTIPDMSDQMLPVNITIMILTILGLIILFRKRRTLKKEYFFFLISAIIILCPSFFIASRLIDGHFLVFSVVLSSIAITSLLKSKIASIIFGLLLFYSWITPSLIFANGREVKLSQSTLANYFQNGSDSSIEFEDKYSRLIKAIKKRAKTGETMTSILTNFDGDLVDKNYQLSISNLFGSYTGLSTLNLRQPEIYHRAVPDITKSKFLLLNISMNELNDQYFKSHGYEDSSSAINFIKNNFQIIFNYSADDEIPLYCYYNKSTDTFKEIIPKFKFPLYLGDGLLLALIGIILFDSRRKIRNAK